MTRLIIKYLIIMLSGMAMFLPVVNAEPSSAVAFDLPTLRLLKAADPAKGEALAKETKCSKCHGDAGVSDDPDDSNIAGMSVSYFFKQLKDFKDKKRDDKDMYKKLKDMDDAQMADLAAWYASLEPAPANPNRVLTAEVRKLVFHGDPKRLLKACAACHGKDGRGGQFDHPAIAGQIRTYLVDSMLAFKEGDRTNDIYSRMRHVSEVLTEEEIEALADYYASYIPDEEDEDEEEADEEVDAEEADAEEATDAEAASDVAEEVSEAVEDAEASVDEAEAKAADAAAEIGAQVQDAADAGAEAAAEAQEAVDANTGNE